MVGKPGETKSPVGVVPVLTGVSPGGYDPPGVTALKFGKVNPPLQYKFYTAKFILLQLLL